LVAAAISGTDIVAAELRRNRATVYPKVPEARLSDLRLT
jgi:hypothetical protein